MTSGRSSRPSSDRRSGPRGVDPFLRLSALDTQHGFIMVAVWSGMGRISGAPGCSNTSVSLLFSNRTGFPSATGAAASSDFASISRCLTTGMSSLSTVVSQVEPHQTPSAPSASGSYLATGSYAARVAPAAATASTTSATGSSTSVFRCARRLPRPAQ